ncbi:MAG: hypothetical protein AAFV93_21710 [Chloroflexota bacterium]
MSTKNLPSKLISAGITLAILLITGAVFAQDGALLRTQAMNEMWTSTRQTEMLQEQVVFNGNPEEIVTVVITNHDIESGLVTNITNLSNNNIISSGNVEPGAQIVCIPPTSDMFVLNIELTDQDNTDGYDALITDNPNFVCDESLIESLLVDESSIVLGEGNSDSDVDDDEEGDEEDEDNDNEDGEDLTPFASCEAIPNTSASTVNIRELPSLGADVINITDASEALIVIGRVTHAPAKSRMLAATNPVRPSNKLT